MVLTVHTTPIWNCFQFFDQNHPTTHSHDLMEITYLLHWDYYLSVKVYFPGVYNPTTSFVGPVPGNLMCHSYDTNLKDRSFCFFYFRCGQLPTPFNLSSSSRFPSLGVFSKTYFNKIFLEGSNCLSTTPLLFLTLIPLL